MAKLGGYMGKILRVDLTNERLTHEKVDEATLRKFLGGPGWGTKIMYDEVPAAVEWSDPRNRLIFATGVLTGSRAPGGATYAVVTKGPLTNLLGAAHSNGFFGTRLKFAGYDAIIVQGAAKSWVYLYVHDGVAELRSATHLLGKDTQETEDILRKEIGQPKLSVSCIGPAGENLVKFAAVVCDGGHVASTNGPGAVMGSKKLKAIAAYGEASVPIHDKARFNALVKDWWEQAKASAMGSLVGTLGTAGYFSLAALTGWGPVKNCTTNIYPEHPKFNGDSIRANFKLKPKPCYACRLGHGQEIEIAEGPHKGVIVEEPEYEDFTSFGSMIGSTDINAAMWLTNVNDRLGMDVKEEAFVVGLAMECYNKGILTKKDTNGVDLTWGNVEGVETLLYKIAHREGFGDVLAEGVMRAAKKIGGDAPKFAVYTKNGIAPHVLDIRGLWPSMFMLATSDMGSLTASIADVGDLLDANEGMSMMDPSQAFSAEGLPRKVRLLGHRGHFVDSIGICMHVEGATLKTLSDTVGAATGWDFTWQEAVEVGQRVQNLMRVFNIRHGSRREDDRVSPRLVEAPVDGGAKGMTIGPKYEGMLNDYYQGMGWDKEGRPLPETLKKLGLEFAVRELEKKVRR